MKGELVLLPSSRHPTQSSKRASCVAIPGPDRECSSASSRSFLMNFSQFGESAQHAAGCAEERSQAIKTRRSAAQLRPLAKVPFFPGKCTTATSSRLAGPAKRIVQGLQDYSVHLSSIYELAVPAGTLVVRVAQSQAVKPSRREDRQASRALVLLPSRARVM